MLYPIAIYTVPMLSQRCEIGSVLRIPFTLGLVTCHPTGCSPNQLTLLLLTFCPLHSTLYCRRLIFLIYQFETGLFNMRIYVSSQLIIIRRQRQRSYFGKLYPAFFVFDTVIPSATYDGLQLAFYLTCFTLSTFSIKVRRVFLKYLVCFILKKLHQTIVLDQLFLFVFTVVYYPWTK